MEDYRLDHQAIEEMTEVLLRRLPERLTGQLDEFKLVSMDILCDVEEERLTQLTVFFNTNTLQVISPPKQL